MQNSLRKANLPHTIQYEYKKLFKNITKEANELSSVFCTSLKYNSCIVQVLHFKSNQYYTGVTYHNLVVKMYIQSTLTGFFRSHTIQCFSPLSFFQIDFTSAVFQRLHQFDEPVVFRWSRICYNNLALVLNSFSKNE